MHTWVFNIFQKIEGTVGVRCLIDAHGVVDRGSVSECGRGVKKFK